MKNIIMKTNIVRYIQKGIKGTLGLLALGLMLTNCYDTPEFSESLALNNDLIVLSADGGTTRIRVFADKNWNVKLDEPADWLQFQSTSGRGNGEFMLDYATNKYKDGYTEELNPARMAKLIVSSDDRVDTLVVKQKGRIPKVNIPDLESYALSRAGVNRIVLETNVDFEKITKNVIYPEGEENEEWLTELTYKEGSIYMNLTENREIIQRSVKISLDYTDVMGTNTTDTVTVVQLPPSGESTATEVSFDKVREYVASFPAGVEKNLNKNEYIHGIVISRKNERNLAPDAEVGNTVYLQSMDGEQAFRLKILEAKYNNYNYGDEVHISLYKVKAIREENPDCITITNLKISNLLYKGDAQMEPAVRSRTIAELNDRDMFNLVAIGPSVEIAVPFGNFGNQNNGYFPNYLKQNIYPIGIRDINGDFMYMLSNTGKLFNGASENTTGVIYQRSPLPKGAGTIKGIIVHEELSHYGGDMGRYSIRQLAREDVALATEREEGFSTVLAEWSKFEMPTEGNKYLLSETGVGTLSHSKCVFNKTVATGKIGPGPDYDGFEFKGIVDGGAFACDSWWSDGKGAWWLIEVPTKNVTNPLSLQILAHSDATANSSASGPRNFAVEWSSDGTNWKEVGRYKLQEIVVWGYVKENQVPGYHTYNFNLPNEVLGLDKLSIRLRVTDKESCYIGGGEFSNDKVSRLGHVSLKFNK